ncbi:MAG: D-tyrosyl-tRNA(Tyr) deacylase [Gammaproteobacteria bacterium]|nr:MAG: D-tyrosyl-tRNA(Tyr) deacylase [Gammaproteobacteria bacterium]PIE36886.1 MAG: D-tyrosyl-tRNA(Tyr) deacylase [Gammaproteobacteria bacterium]
MKALVQRVSTAGVSVAGTTVARIGPGMLALIGIERDDDEASAAALLERLCVYRMFSDAAGRMNLDIGSVGGELLLVSQFTLVADTRKGRRPGFSGAATPAEAERLFDYLCELADQRMAKPVGRGVFGADMQVSLVNDGPVTFMLEVTPSSTTTPPSH